MRAAWTGISCCQLAQAAPERNALSAPQLTTHTRAAQRAPPAARAGKEYVCEPGTYPRKVDIPVIDDSGFKQEVIYWERCVCVQAAPPSTEARLYDGCDPNASACFSE